MKKITVQNAEDLYLLLYCSYCYQQQNIKGFHENTFSFYFFLFFKIFLRQVNFKHETALCDYCKYIRRVQVTYSA